MIDKHKYLTFKTLLKNRYDIITIDGGMAKLVAALSSEGSIH